MLDANIGERVITGTGIGGTTGFFDWFNTAIHSYNLNNGIWPFFLLTFVIIGILILVGHREWKSLAFLIIALLLPIVLVSTFNLARGAFSRYGYGDHGI